MIRRFMRALTVAAMAFVGLGAGANTASAQDTGACCYSGGCLEEVDGGTCDAFQGVFYPGQTCAGAGCYGACCTVSGSCYDTTPENCGFDPDNLFAGTGTTCATTECPDRRGSCCFPTFCWEGVGENQCVNSGGVFTLGGTCISTACYGACCSVYGSCFETSQANCESDPDNIFQGNGVSCAETQCDVRTGSCCFGTFCWENVGQFQCQNSGGVFTLGGTCVSTGCYGACCTVSGSCYETTQSQCDAQQDTIFNGPGTTCATTNCPNLTGACCANGFCFDSGGEEQCASSGGTFFLGQTCQQASCPGACCLPDQSCTIATEQDCLAASGSFGGSLTNCSEFLCVTACSNSATLVSSAYRIFPSSILIEDFNRDGWFDVAFVAEDSNLLAAAAVLPSCGPPEATAGAFGGGEACGSGGGQRRVHVLNGATNYTSELSGWPVPISGLQFTVTASSGDINFDGFPDLMVGNGAQCDSFRFNGTETPGWETVPSEFPFLNAFTVTDSNADGAPDLVCVDESTFYQRYQALGRKWQCQYVTDPVFSTAAVGDVGRRHLTLPRVADGTPDAVTCGEQSLSMPNPIRVWNTFGTTLDCVLSPPGGFQDQLFQVDPPDVWFSSPALARLDRVTPTSATLDAAQDIVLVNNQGWLRVYHSTAPALPAEVQLGTGLQPRVCLPHYSSPAIVDLNSDGLRQEILVGSDDGRIYAFRYDPTIASPSARLIPVSGWVGGKLLDAGAAIGASPIVADVVGDTRPEVIVANDAGKVYIIDWQGNTLSSWCCKPSQAVTPAAAIYSTPAVWVRRPTAAAGNAARKPVIFAGNRYGLWRIDLASSPDFVTTRAQWPTFHKDNGRTGAWKDYAVNPQMGSIGGIVCSKRGGVELSLFFDDRLTQPVPDPQTPSQQYRFTSVSDGRFVFDMLKEGTYYLLYENDDGSPYAKKVPVTVGKMTFLKGCCRLVRPGAGRAEDPTRVSRLLDALHGIELQASMPVEEGAPSPVEIILEALDIRELDAEALDPLCYIP
ncbi:MAG: FG-GAP repeat domain-containing protein [Phycisphaerales bacterium]